MATDKKGKCAVIVGATGSGKSYLLEQLFLNLTDKPNYIFDPNNEHGNSRNRYRMGKSRLFEEMKKFQDYIFNITKSKIVFEEATIFFPNSGMNKDLVELLVRKRHRECDYIFIFHSLRQVPVYISDYVDEWFIKKTKDRADIVKSKFKDDEEIYNAFLTCRKSKNKFETVYINTNKID